MNCEQVRVLVDALPRENWSAAQTALARDHTGQCETCRDVLVTSERLDVHLRTMPEVRLSESLAPSIMARIARERSAPGKVASKAVLVRVKRSWHRWAIPIGCVLGLGAYLVALLSGHSVLTGFGRVSFDAETSTRWLDPLVILAVAGVLLCLLGIGDPEDPAPNTDSRD